MHHQATSLPLPATAWAEGAQLNGRPFPATASVEGAQFNVPPSPWERGHWSMAESGVSSSSYWKLFLFLGYTCTDPEHVVVLFEEGIH